MLLLISAIICLISTIIAFDYIKLCIFFGIILNYICNFFYFDKSFIYISDLGILITMLVIGTHINLKQIMRYFNLMSALFINTIFAGLLVAPALIKVFSINPLCAILIGIITCTSSTVICQQILSVDGRLANSYGQIALIGTIAQDIVAIIIIIFAKILYSGHGSFQQAMFSNLILVIFFITYSLINSYIVKIANNILIDVTDTGKIVLLISASCIVFYLYKLLDHLHVSGEILFLLIGIFFKKVIEKYEDLFEALQRIMLASVFLYTGFCVDFANSYISPIHIFGVFAYITLVKIGFYYTTNIIFRKDFETSIRASILLSSLSESLFFIIWILPCDITAKTSMVIITVLSMSVTPIIFEVVNYILMENIQSKIGIAKYAARMFTKELNEYVLIIGVNKRSDQLSYMLGNQVENVITIDNSIHKVLKYNNSNCFYMDGALKETYSELKFEKMKCIVIAINNIVHCLKVLKTIKKLNKNIQVFVLCYKPDVRQILEYNAIPFIMTDQGSEYEELKKLSNEITLKVLH